MMRDTTGHMAIPASGYSLKNLGEAVTVGPFWNVLEGNFCRSVLEWFGRERSRSHCDQQAFQNVVNGPDTVV